MAVIIGKRLARKGDINLILYGGEGDCLYGVEVVNTSVSYALIYSYDKQKAINCFNKAIKKVKAGKNDFNVVNGKYKP